MQFLTFVIRFIGGDNNNFLAALHIKIYRAPRDKQHGDEKVLGRDGKECKGSYGKERRVKIPCKLFSLT